MKQSLGVKLLLTKKGRNQGKRINSEENASVI